MATEATGAAAAGQLLLPSLHPAPEPAPPARRPCRWRPPRAASAHPWPKPRGSRAAAAPG